MIDNDDDTEVKCDLDFYFQGTKMHSLVEAVTYKTAATYTLDSISPSYVITNNAATDITFTGNFKSASSSVELFADDGSACSDTSGATSTSNEYYCTKSTSFLDQDGYRANLDRALVFV